MNRLLIATLDIANKLIAIFIIVATTFEGYYGDLSAYVGPTYASYHILSAVIGFILGLVVAGEMPRRVVAVAVLPLNLALDRGTGVAASR